MFAFLYCIDYISLLFVIRRLVTNVLLLGAVQELCKPKITIFYT